MADETPGLRIAFAFLAKRGMVGSLGFSINELGAYIDKELDTAQARVASLEAALRTAHNKIVERCAKVAKDYYDAARYNLDSGRVENTERDQGWNLGYRIACNDIEGAIRAPSAPKD